MACVAETIPRHRDAVGGVQESKHEKLAACGRRRSRRAKAGAAPIDDRLQCSPGKEARPPRRQALCAGPGQDSLGLAKQFGVAPRRAGNSRTVRSGSCASWMVTGSAASCEPALLIRNDHSGEDDTKHLILLDFSLRDKPVAFARRRRAGNRRRCDGRQELFDTYDFRIDVLSDGEQLHVSMLHVPRGP